MSSAVAELDAYLQSMLNLKAPGVSGSKVGSITSLCTANIQSESVLIQKIYTHFKKAPSTHKLGVLYVVDSVTRQWVDQARKIGQLPGSGAPDGTFAAGVTRVTELLPVLMNDILNSAPEDQKARIRKLVDIWERSSTFPTKMLSDIKEKLDAPKNVQSTTPEGTPSPDFNLLGQQQPQTNQSQATPTDTSSILAALANLAKQSTAAPPTSGFPAQASMNNMLGAQNGLPQSTPSSVDQGPSATNGQAVNPLGALFAGMSNGVQSQNQNQAQNVAAQNSLASLLPRAQVPAIPQAAPLGQDPQQQQFQLISLMAAQGIPPDQWGAALQLLAPALQGASGQSNVGGVPNFPPPLPGANGWGGQSRDPQGPDYMRSPPSQYRRRSRSPGWDRRRDPSPPRRRDSPVYGDYRGDAAGRNRDDRGGRRGNDYRQRSPTGRRRRSPTPPPKDVPLPPPGVKSVQFDPNLAKGSIKVLSRTLFVGGVTSSEAHLRSLFANFGIVQTCIVNVDKRHAFVKMIDRTDAVAARDGMEQYKSGDMQLRTRWGVGFGPRDCSDYQTGVSIIPIDRLTDADRKWMLTAEYGGTGGRAIESGMVVEEPDIEIGAGVSSKAISRRMATDQGGKRGPQSSRGGNHGSSRPNERPRFNDDNDRPSSSDNSNANSAALPQIPGYNFNFPNFPNGMQMPTFPPGFMMPGMPQQNGSRSG